MTPPMKRQIQGTEIWRQMMSGDIYDAPDKELVSELMRVRALLRRYNDADPTNADALAEFLRENLLGSCGDNLTIV